MPSKFETINANVACKINPDISPSLSPDQLLAHVFVGEGAQRTLTLAQDDDPVSCQAWNAARSAQRLLHDSLSLMTEAVDAAGKQHGDHIVAGGPNIKVEMSNEQKTLLAAELSSKVAKVATQFDAQLAIVNDAAEKYAANIAATLSNPRTDSKTATEQAEISSVYRGAARGQAGGICPLVL